MTTNPFAEPEETTGLRKALSGVSKLRNTHAEIKSIKLPRDMLPRLLSCQIKIKAA